MSTAQATDNRATFRRFHEAVDSGDQEFISKTIDEVVELDVHRRSRCDLAQRRSRFLNGV
jgi:hypothetical protein